MRPVCAPHDRQSAGGPAAAVYSEGLDVGYRWYASQDRTPLFPFGYGLSYTTFSMSHLAVSRRGGTVTVTADVTHTGTRAGADVAQVYVADPPAAGEPPEQLRGFARVTLGPGQRWRVAITLGPRSFQAWDSTAQRWVTATGRYTISLGDSSVNLPLHVTLTGGAPR